MNYVITNADTTSCLPINLGNVSNFKPSLNIVSSENDRRKAVEAIYKMGYITEDEAKQLIDQEYAQRNKYTAIHLDDYVKIIIISCYENDPCATQSKVKLFQLKYVKHSGKVEEVGQEYLLGEIY